MDNAEFIQQLTQAVENGAKIYDVIRDKGKLLIIQGLEILADQSNVLISSHDVIFTPELDALLESEKFKHAMYKPSVRGIILVDIAGYSKGNTLYQSAALVIFSQMIKELQFDLQLFSKVPPIDMFIPTGDGCYIVFNEALNDRFFRAVFMINSIMPTLQNRMLRTMGKSMDESEKLHLRMACTLREIDYFYDVAGNRNCYGVGMNEAARILTYGQQQAESNNPGITTHDTVFFDETVWPQAEPIIKYIQSITPPLNVLSLGSVGDKHGEYRDIWWLKDLPSHFAVNMHSWEEFSVEE